MLFRSGSGTSWDSVTVTGDITLVASGLATVRNRKVLTGMFVANAVSTAEIQSQGVVSFDISSRSITAEKIVEDGVTSNEIAAGTINSTEIADRTVSTINFGASAVTTAEIANLSVSSNDIAGNIPNSKLIQLTQSGLVSGNSIISGTITQGATFNTTGKASIAAVFAQTMGVGTSDISSTLQVAGSLKTAAIESGQDTVLNGRSYRWPATSYLSGDALVRTGTNGLTWNLQKSEVTARIVLDGASTAIIPGFKKYYLVIPKAMTLSNVKVFTDRVTNATINVLKGTVAVPPTSGATSVFTAKPTLSNMVFGESSSISLSNLVQDDILCVNIDQNSAAEFINIVFLMQSTY